MVLSENPEGNAAKIPSDMLQSRGDNANVLVRADTELAESRPHLILAGRNKSLHPIMSRAPYPKLSRPNWYTAWTPSRAKTADMAAVRQGCKISKEGRGLSTASSRHSQDQQQQQQPRPLVLGLGLNKSLPRELRPVVWRNIKVAANDQQEADGIEAVQDNYGSGQGFVDLEKGLRHPALHRHESRGVLRGGERDVSDPGKGKLDAGMTCCDAHSDQSSDQTKALRDVDDLMLTLGDEPGEKDEISPVFGERVSVCMRSRSDDPRQSAPEEYATRSLTRVNELNDRERANQRSNEVSPSGSVEAVELQSRQSGNDDDWCDELKFAGNERQEFTDPYELQLEYKKLQNPVARFRAWCPRVWAEFWGTCIAVTLGICINLSTTGLAFMIGIYLSAGVSGAHLNPVITLVFTLFRGFPWRQSYKYIIAQFLGGFLGGAIAYAVYHDALNAVDPERYSHLTGGAFFPGPQTAVPMKWSAAFGSEILSTAILIMVILALGDDQNAPPGAGLAPFVIALVVACEMMAFGYNSGPTMNPARDTGPRIVAYLAKYRDNPFSNAFWAYGAIGGTFLGGFAGAVFYDVFIFVGGESPLNWPLAPVERWVGLVVRGLASKWSRLASRIVSCFRKTRKAGNAATNETRTSAATARDVWKQARKQKQKSQGVRMVYGGRTVR